MVKGLHRIGSSTSLDQACHQGFCPLAVRKSGQLSSDGDAAECDAMLCPSFPGYSRTARTCFAQHLHRYPWKYAYVIISVYDVYSMYAYVCMCICIYIYTYYVYIYIFMNIHILCIYLWMTSNDLTVTSLEWCFVRGVIPKWPNSSAISGWWIMTIQPAILLYDAICTKKEHTHCIAYTSR